MAEEKNTSIEENIDEEKKALFTAEQLKVGVASVNENEVHLFLKVDPRIIMDAMDEKFGPMNWDKETTIISFGQNSKSCKCVIRVRNKDGSETSRSDYSATAIWAGPNEYKVMDSDAFRRAAMNFGVGRELYSFDNIIVPVKDSKGQAYLNTVKVQEYVGDQLQEKLICTNEFYVEQLKYKDGKIVALAIKTTEGVTVFAENRENTRLQGTIVDGVTNIPGLKEARELKAGLGKNSDVTLGELNKEELLYVWSNTKDPEIKKACLVVAKGNPESKALFKSKGISI